ncbi:hypothetical protein, partial [Epilithonimonas xixisoli]|uniref:hypothetical protein n=1 Tax=Epilithonimonas xixisoli TaxID=1476462 RepID=UPI001C8817C6
ISASLNRNERTKFPIRLNKKYCRQHRFGNSGVKYSKSTLSISILFCILVETAGNNLEIIKNYR